jgi:hypothetical protein
MGQKNFGPYLCDEAHSTAGAVGFSPLFCSIFKLILQKQIFLPVFIELNQHRRVQGLGGARRRVFFSAHGGSQRGAQRIWALLLRRACAGAIVFALPKAAEAAFKRIIL